jgi:hypothetical protein
MYENKTVSINNLDNEDIDFSIDFSIEKNIKYDFNYAKLDICVSILNEYIGKLYKKYQSFDKEYFTEFRPCCDEEKKILEKTIKKALDHFANSKNSENVIYWGVIYYYYNTVIVEYNAISMYNQPKMKRYMEKKIHDLFYQNNLFEIDKINSVKFTYLDIFLITNIMLEISFSNDEWASYIRKTVLFQLY